MHGETLLLLWNFDKQDKMQIIYIEFRATLKGITKTMRYQDNV